MSNGDNRLTVSLGDRQEGTYRLHGQYKPDAQASACIFCVAMECTRSYVETTAQWMLDGWVVVVREERLTLAVAGPLAQDYSLRTLT